MNGQNLGLTQDWLQDGAQSMNAMNTTSGGGGCGTTTGAIAQLTTGSTWYYPNTGNHWPNYVYFAPPSPRPIKLAMSEVDRLRKAAKADEKLKAILAKFTDQIEIVVDFE